MINSGFVRDSRHVIVVPPARHFPWRSKYEFVEGYQQYPRYSQYPQQTSQMPAVWPDGGWPCFRRETRQRAVECRRLVKTVGFGKKKVKILDQLDMNVEPGTM